MNPLARYQRGLAIVTSVGFAGLLAALASDAARALTNLLIVAVMVLGICMGAMVLLALNTVASAGWHIVLKRVFEGLGAALPLGAVLLVATLPGLPVLYEWARPEAASDPLLHLKAAYLNAPFFSLRMVLILAVWLFFTRKLRQLSLRQDQSGDVALSRKAVATSAGFLAAFAVTCCMGAFDWLMSLEARWFSTIFGLYNIAGFLQSGVAGVILVALALRHFGVLKDLGRAHLHDLGKLLFGFSTLWAYLWFSQFLLIWYTNLPEETIYFERRWVGGWTPLFFLVLIINWALPFLLLSTRAAKRNGRSLAAVAGVVLVGRWMDLYLMAAPANFAERPLLPGWIELAAVMGAFGALLLMLIRIFGGLPMQAKHDPYLVESLHHHA